MVNLLGNAEDPLDLGSNGVDIGREPELPVSETKINVQVKVLEGLRTSPPTETEGTVKLSTVPPQPKASV